MQSNTSRVSIAKNIAAARVRAGLTPIQLAKKVGVSPSSVCEWELADHEPRLPTLRKLAKVLRVSLAELVGAA